MDGARAPARVLLVDGYAGVRSAVRDILVAAGIAVHVEAGTVAAARSRPAEVVVANLVLPDGTAAALAGERPVVAYTWLPEGERPDVDEGALAAVVAAGTLRTHLAAAVRDALALPPA